MLKNYVTVMALEYLDNYGKSIAIMQAFSSFSLGGSISVNGYSWQKDVPPIAASVISFTLLQENGEIIECSRSQHQELFKLVIGGYGLFGIILDVKLKVVDNEALQFKFKHISADKYLSYSYNFV